MTATKPTAFINWVPDGTSVNLATPPQAVSQSGFQPSQPVAAQWMNSILRTLDQWNQYLAEGVNSTVLATSLDHSMRLVGGGSWSYSVATGVLAWSMPFQLACPSAPDSDNQAAAGQVTLTPGSVAYVTANLPFSTVGDLTQGSVTVQNLGYDAGIVVGQTVSGLGIADGTTVASVSDTTCTLSKAATQSVSQGALTFVGSAPLTVTAAVGRTLVPGPNTVIIARAISQACSVGVGSTEMWLRDKEQRSLIAAGYISTVQGPAGSALTAMQLVYMSFGLTDNRTAGSVYPVDAGTQNGATRATALGFMHTDTAQGSMAHIVQAGFLNGFTGLVQGLIYYADPQTPGGITSTKPTAAGQWVVPVGYALSSTMLLVQVDTPQSVTTVFPAIQVLGNSALNTVNATGAVTFKPTASGNTLSGFNAAGTNTWSITDAGALTIQSIESKAGIKTVLDMGGYWNTNQGNPEASIAVSVKMQKIAYDTATGNMGQMDRIWLAPYGGQLLGMTFRVYSSKPFSPTFEVFKNNGVSLGQLQGGSTGTGVYGSYAKALPRGSGTFAALDTLYVQCNNVPNGTNIQIGADIIIELTS